MKKIKFRFKNFLMLTVAGIINAIGVTMFLAPVNLYDSGISGTSILLSQISPEFFSLSLFLLLLNIPLFLYGCKKAGKYLYRLCGIYSIYIFTFRLFNNRCLADRCQHCFSACRKRPFALCNIRRTDFRYRKRNGNKIRRSDGRNRGYGGNILKKARHNCRHFCHEL